MVGGRSGGQRSPGKSSSQNCMFRPVTAKTEIRRMDGFRLRVTPLTRRDNHPATRPGSSHESCCIIQVAGPKFMARSPYPYRPALLEAQVSATQLFDPHICKANTGYLRLSIAKNFAVPRISRTKRHHAALSPGYQNEQNLSPISIRQDDCGNDRLQVLSFRLHLFHCDTEPLLHSTALL